MGRRKRRSWEGANWPDRDEGCVARTARPRSYDRRESATRTFSWNGSGYLRSICDVTCQLIITGPRQPIRRNSIISRSFDHGFERAPAGVSNESICRQDLLSTISRSLFLQAIGTLFVFSHYPEFLVICQERRPRIMKGTVPAIQGSNCASAHIRLFFYFKINHIYSVFTSYTHDPGPHRRHESAQKWSSIWLFESSHLNWVI